MIFFTTCIIVHVQVSEERYLNSINILTGNEICVQSSESPINPDLRVVNLLLTSLETRYVVWFGYDVRRQQDDTGIVGTHQLTE